MKKLMAVIVTLVLAIGIFAAYPTYNGINDPAYQHALNGTNLELTNKTVNVKIMQWISGNFIDRATLNSARGLKEGANLISSDIVLTKPGLVKDQIFGAIAVISNGLVDIAVAKDNIYAPTNKVNISDNVSGLKLVEFNQLTKLPEGGYTFTKDIADAIPASGYTLSGSGVTSLKGNSRLNGNPTGTILGPEFLIAGDINVPFDMGPADNYIVVFDIVVSPKGKF
ncbi:MAG TPA: hypothetical protein PLM73_04990 [Petrotogaceae bacterium]|nr:hypothetical protein [Petrotogaceae bacterium]HQH32541.1 hypothetical protein [Petrotogaceae bacterium]HQI78993.1 hypothetical protein [Petrotogaceae bacterium]